MSQNGQPGYFTPSDSDEPEAVMEPQLHPLWHRVYQNTHKIPEQFKRELLVEQRLTAIQHVAMYIVTDRQRLLLQNAYGWCQSLGGGKHTGPLCYKAHACRREAFWEGNISCNSPSIMRISPPFVVTSNYHGKTTSCWVQFMLARDDAFVEQDDGTLTFDGKPVWSREKARGPDCYRAKSSAGTVNRGQWRWNWEKERHDPIFHLFDLHVYLNGILPDTPWYLLRGHDWDTARSLKEELMQCSRGIVVEHSRTAYGLVEHAEWLLAQQYFAASEEMLRKWSCYMGRVAEESWPLLTKSVLYTIVYTRWNEQFLARCIIAETLELDLEQETKNEE